MFLERLTPNSVFANMQKGKIGHDPKIVTGFTKIVNKNTLLRPTTFPRYFQDGQDGILGFGILLWNCEFEVVILENDLSSVIADVYAVFGRRGRKPKPSTSSQQTHEVANEAPS